MRSRRVTFALLFLCLALNARAQVSYTENSDSHFNAGSYNSTLLSGAGTNVNLGLDHYGRAAGLSAPGSEGWFNSAWNYRQQLTINSANPAALSNYPVPITLNTQDLITSGRMNADGSDIRFTTSAAAGGAAAIPYYIESGINSPATKIWVKVPSIAPGASVIQMYSGYAGAAATSSMPDVFLLGSDFNAADGSAPSSSTWINTESATPAAGSARDIQSNRLRLHFGSPLNLRHYGLRSAGQYSFAAGRRYHAEINARNTGGDSWSSFTLCPTLYTYSYDQDDWLRFSVKHSAAGPVYTVEKSEYGIKSTLVSATALGAGFHSVDFLISPSSFKVLLDGSQIYSAANNLVFNSPYIYLEASTANSALEDFLFDNVLAAPYSSPEPAYGSAGQAQGRYYSSGAFTSQIKDSGAAGTRVRNADWEAITPSSAAVSLEMRAHDTDVLLGTFTAAAKGGDPAVAGRYLQYRLNLATQDPRYTAALSSLTLTYISPPLAPSGAVGTALSVSSLKWNWTDNSSGQYQEDGFRVLDATGTLQGSVAAGTTYWIETGLTPNTQYSRRITGYNAAGNGVLSAVSRYTLSVSPNVGCDKSTGTWLSGSLNCSNLAGFGPNGLAYYRYAWTQSPSYPTWSGTEAQWTSGLLSYSPPTGEYYLHVRAYNGDNFPAAADQTYGPYWYDKTAPSVTGFSPSSSPWTNSGLSAQVSLSDSGGAKLSRVRYRWTTSSDRPAVGWQAWSYAISGNDTAASDFTIGSAGQWYLHVEVEDTAGNAGYAYAGVYKVDLTKPTGGIIINGGDANTPTREVTLALTYADDASGVKNLAYKNLGGGAFTAPELPQPSTTWTLTEGEGSRQVYVQVTDNAGNTQQYADTITLDPRTSLLGAALNATASGVMGEPAETFAPGAVLSWTPTGVPLSGKTLSFYFSGATQTAVTNAFGSAASVFNVPAASGTYVYSVSFSTDGVYYANSSTGTLQVAPRGASLITEDVNATSGAEFTAKAILKDFEWEAPIAGATVTFVFENSTKTAETNGIGVATVTFNAPVPVGFYDYSASYAGSPAYAAKAATGRIGVGLRVTSLVTQGVTALAQAQFDAQATLLDGALPVEGAAVNFFFQGSTQTAVTNASGIAVRSFTAPASSGSYAYAAAFDGDGTYAASSGGAALTVNRRPLSLAGEAGEGYVNASFEARAVLSDGVTGQKVEGKPIVFLFESSSATVPTDVNGVAAAVFDSGSLPRASTCYYYFSGDTGYSFADSTAAVSIDRRPAALSASDAAALLNSTFTAIAELKDTAFTPAAIPGKTITFSFRGEIKTAVTDALGVASATYQTGLSTGAYEFYVSFDQDALYLADNDTGTITMGKRPSVVSAYPWFGFALDAIRPVADLKDGVTGEYIGSQPMVFSYNGVVQATTTVASGGTMGKAYAVYPSTGVAGAYSYFVDFPGNSMYSANSGTAAITVTPRAANLSAFPQTAVLNTTFTVTAEFRDGATGALVGGKEVKITFAAASANAVTSGAGIASSTFTTLASTGVFNWLAEFAGDQAYARASSTGTVTVTRRAPTLTPIAASKYVWDSVFFNAAFFDEGSPIAAKQISFYFMGSTRTAATNAAGMATAGPFAAISTPGAYGYTAQFAGDTDYSAQTGSSTLTVNARPSNINLGPVSAIANSTVTLTAALLDSNDGARLMSGKAVSFTLQGATYAVSAVTDAEGIARAVYTASSITGDYTYSATFAGNTNYAASSSSNTLTVTVRPSVLEMADYYPPANSTFTVSAVLKDFATGGVISAKTVSFLFLGVTRTGVTDALGSAATNYATLSSTMSYPVTASFAGDALYAPASINKVVFPARRDTTLQTAEISATAKDSFNVTARLRDFDQAYYIAGATITFSFSGSTYTLTALTSSTGTAIRTFTAPSSTGSYTYTATFAGDTLYNGAANTSAVTVNRRTLTLTPGDVTGVPANSTFTVSALLLDGALTISTKTLTFIFISTKTAITNDIGVASTSFLAPLSTGTFSYKVTYTGDALYNPATSYANVGVVLKPTVLEVLDVPDAVVGLNFTGTAKLRDIEMGNALVLSTKTITFVFSTTTSNSVTSVGVATAAMVAPLVIGAYTYTASFAGDGTYGASQSTGTVTVKRRPVMFSVEINPAEPYTLSTFTVKGTLYDGKVAGLALANKTLKFYFSVSNTTKTVVTDALGIASTTFYAGISSGDYRCTGAFEGDESYSPSEANDQSVKTVTIVPRPTSIQAYQGNGQLLNWGTYTFNNFSPIAYVVDPLNDNVGIPGLTVSFIIQGQTITGVTAASPLGQAVSGSAFPYIATAGTYPAEVRFAGNQTYAPSVLPGGTNWSEPKEGKVLVHLSPANIAMDAIQESYPNEDKVISGVAHDGYLGDRANARPQLVGLQVRYLVSSTPCTLPACTEPRNWTIGPSWGVVNASYVATATVHTPSVAGDYPIDRYFANTSSFYYWWISEDQRVLRVGLRPTRIQPALDPFVFGAQMPITIKVKLESTSEGNIGVVGKHVIITFNGGAPQDVVTTAGGFAQYTFAGLPVGNYTYTATFAGDTAYNLTSLSPIGQVTVEKNTTLLTATDVTQVPAGNTFTAKATLNVLVGTAQEPAAGRTINFTFPGNVNAGAVTNAQGVAQVTFTSPQTPGNYTFTADLPENENDLAASDTGAVQVVKRRTSLVSVAVNPVYILDNFTSTATLTDLDAPPNLASLVGQTINFTLHRGGAEGDISGAGTTAASPLGQATRLFASPAESGSKSYSASYAGDTLYAAVTASDAGVNVLKRTTILTSPVEPTIPTNTIFTATVTLRDNTPTLGTPVPMGPGVHVPVKFVYNGITRYGTTNDSGVATATFTAQSVSGDYTCNITFEGNATYAVSSLALPVHVIKRTTHVTGTVINNQPAGAPFTAQATLTDDISGSGIGAVTLAFVFTGGGTFSASDTTDGVGIATAAFTAPLSTGTYNYTACFAGNNTYAGHCDNSNSVTVNVASTTLGTPDATVTVNNIFFATATLTGKESGDGIANKAVSFTYNGVLKGQPSTNINGIAVQSFTPASTGTFRLDVAFAGDAAFYASAGSATITVNRRASGITLPNATVEIGALFIASATLRDLTVVPSTWIAGRTVNFLFDGTPKTGVTNSVGVATVSYNGPGVSGPYPITVSFTGDPIYDSTNTAATISVAKHETQLTMAGATVTALELFNATATLKTGGAPVQGKTIQFTYNGANLSGVTDANGRAFVQYNSGPSSGAWRVDAVFDGSADTAYNTSSGSNTITVLRRTCVVAPDNVSVPVFGVFNATAAFRDVASSSTPAGKVVSVAFNWVPLTSTYTATPTNASGLAYYQNVTAPSSSGTYRVEAFYTGDATYAPSAASTATITVTRRSSQLSLANASTMIGRVFTATATLRSSSTPLEDKYVLFTFEGKNFSVKTGAGGSAGIAVATFTVTVSTGPSQINAVFNGDPTYFNSNTATATVTASMRPTSVVPAAASAVADKVFVATATLKDIDNLNVAARTVSFLFNGDTVTGVTNGVGVATAAFTANVATGTYSIAVSFNGDYKYIASSTTLPLTVLRRTTSLVPLGGVTVRALDVFFATATLKDIDLAPLPGKPVRFVFEGGTFNLTTNGSGVAVSSWSAPASSGAYNVEAYFDGDAMNLPSAVSIGVDNQQRPAGIALNALSAAALELFRTTATLTDLNNGLLKISDRPVTFSFSWGANTSALTNGVGVATASYTSTGTAGVYQLTGSFAGDATYASTSTVVPFPVAKRSGFVTGVYISTRVLDVFTASGTFYDSANSAPVPGRTMKFILQHGSTLTAVTNGSGIASVNFTAHASSGTYALYISNGNGDDTYNPVSVYVSSVTMNRRDSSITLTGPAATIINSSFTAAGALSDSVSAGTVQSRVLSFLFQGTTMTATTGVSGATATVYTASLTSGTYRLQASFAGDATYNPCVSTRSVAALRYPTLLAAPAINTVINEVLTATATLTDYKASTVPAKNLVFAFQALPFNAATNALGVAYSTYSANVASGTYTLPVSFAGDALYDSTSTSIPVLVNKRTAMISPDPVTSKALDIFVASATLADARDPAQKLAGETVVFEFMTGLSTYTDSGVTDANGLAVSTFTAPAASGIYQVRASYAGSALYYPRFNYGLVTVIPRPSKLMQDNSAASIDEVFRTTATLVDLATSLPVADKTVTFAFGASSSALTNGGGRASVSYTAPGSSGAYQLSAVFAGDPTYEASSSTGTLTVSRRPVALTPPDIAGTVDEVFSATVTVTDALDSSKVAGRNVEFVFSGAAFTSVTGADGVAVSTFLAPSSSGTYYAAVNFAGDARFLPNGTTVQIAIDRRPAAIDPAPVTARAAQVFTATAALTDVRAPAFKIAGRPLAFLFAGSTFTALTDADGIAVSTFMAPASSGTAAIYISFEGDSRYQAASSSETFPVLRRLSLLTIDPAAIKTMDVLTATATLIDAADPASFPQGREITFTFSAQSFASVTDAGGIAVSTFAGPVSSGSYIVSAGFAGDSVYEAASSTMAVEVTPRPAGITAAGGVAFPFEQFIATATLEDAGTAARVPGRTLVLTLNGSPKAAVTDPVGIATAAYTPPGTFGDYELSAAFGGDATYAAASATATVSVMRRPTAVAPLDTAAIALDVFVASATLSDVRFSTTLAGKEFVFNFEGQSSTAATGADGLAFASFSAPVSSGTYYYEAAFAGDGVYGASSSTGAVAVATRVTRIIARDANANVGEPFKLSAQLLDPAKEELPGYYVSNVELKFTFKDRNNQKIDEAFATTNELGVASVTFSGPGAPDVYYYTASFAGDFTYSASSATAMVKVGLLTSLVAYDVETVALEKFTGKAKLTDYLSTTLDDKTIRFRFLGAANSGITNALGDSGVASSSFTAPASSGTYYYNAYFDGDAIYSASNATATIVVKLRPASLLTYPAETFAYSSFTASVLLKNVLSPYANIGGRNIDIAFNGSTVTAATDPGTGVASAVFFAPVSSGTYDFYASFGGDDSYEPSLATGTLTVQFRPTSMLSYNVSDLTANSTFTARVQLKNSGNQPIAGLGVDFEFGGVFGIGVTDAQGMAETVFTAPPSSGVYTYTANFYGDERYAPSSAAGSVTVGPRPTILFTPAASSKLGVPVGLSARLVDVAGQGGIEGQTINFYFGGSTLAALTDAFGVSSAVFAAPASTGIYSYEAAFQGDGITYIGSSSSAPVTIALNLTTLEARGGLSIKIYEPLEVEAVLKDYIGLNMPGMPVTFDFEGLEAADITDGFGKATATLATITLASTGTFSYTASYPGDLTYVASADTANVVNVYRRDSLLIARDNQAPPNKAFTAEARLYDNVNGSVFMGSPVQGKTLIFEFHDSTFTQTRSAVTSALGVSTVSFFSPASTGTFLLTARFADADPVYEGALSSASLTVLLDDGSGAIKTKLRVENVNSYITHAFTASGTLTASDLPVSGKTILFEFFNGAATSTAAGFTDDVGLATAAFSAPASSGAYFITATFAGDTDFSSAYATATLTARLYPDTLVAQDVSAYGGEEFPARAVMRDDLTLAYVAGRTIIFEFFNGISTVTKTAVTSSTGSAETKFMAPSMPGDYFYTARFAGDTEYVGNMDTASVLIASRGSSTFLVGYDVFIGTGEVFAASATLTSKGAPVQGKAVTLTFEGLSLVSTTNAQGLAFASFTAPASSGAFAYQADFAGDPEYNATLATAPVAAVFRKQPEQPVFKAEVTSAAVTLAWTPVTAYQGQVYGYEVETAAKLRPDTWDNRGFVPSTAPALGYTCPIASNTATYLKIKTKLDDNQESVTSLIVEVPSYAEDHERVPNYYYMSQDNSALVKIPGKVMDKLSGTTPFSVTIKEKAEPGFLKAYDIRSSGLPTAIAANINSGDRKGVKMSIAYPRQTGAGTAAASGQMALYWYNGVEWIKLGGELDVLAGEVYTYARTFGQFAIKAAPLSSTFNLTKVAPRIFSPDEPDPTNTINRATFVFENPGCGEVTIRIFDITGALVRRNLEASNCNVMFWNGKDQGGAAVKGGVYIYQIEAAEKVLTGTVVVAK